jgi:succinate dehydrogenase / fumarate reductase, cytochrome b subunit
VKARPKNLNLFTIKFPLPAIVSILHRITGVCLFILVPIILWLFNYSLDEAGFATIKAYAAMPLVKGLICLAFIPLCFHLVAGIRHLLVDLHIADSLARGRLSAQLTLVVASVLIILLGVWLW